MYSILLIVLSCSLINGFPRQENAKNVAAEPKQLLYIIERLESGLDELQRRPQQQQLEKQTVSENKRQPISSDVPYSVAYLEPQFQYPGFNFLQEQQVFPRCVVLFVLLP